MVGQHNIRVLDLVEIGARPIQHRCEQVLKDVLGDFLACLSEPAMLFEAFVSLAAGGGVQAA